MMCPKGGLIPEIILTCMLLMKVWIPTMLPIFVIGKSQNKLNIFFNDYKEGMAMEFLNIELKFSEIA